ncbi:LysM peptidoglycan-binding domain-containing protein [Bacillus sp. FJAT-29790]|uniref:LysM peptidoglycan-binding domain-containing protein n=1 Tax=Bacillus sp. FJAT-29790 TaxID=1895002 RepID=UPI001C2163F5|nr:LysM peptidoglycan-binding domain-containing protein [Bacillus sp. FJAT-29790]MBU8879143.1 LysM peptidoglycan-binding domain-containing protein [Bacillus sp. FJAT-29790]
MNKEDPYRDQAERLRKKIVKKREPDENLIEKESMPPRSRLHREKKKKTKWKLKYPVIRLLALFFILLPITIYSMYNYLSRGHLGNSEKASSSQPGYETVEKEKETKVEEREKEKEKEKETETETIPPSEKKASGGEKAVEAEISIPVPKPPVVGDSGDKGSISDENKESPETGAKPKEDKQVNVQEEPAVRYHTVQPNETVYRIAMNYYQSPSGIEIIKKANNLKGNEILAGQVLVIPKSN